MGKGRAYAFLTSDLPNQQWTLSSLPIDDPQSMPGQVKSLSCFDFLKIFRRLWRRCTVMKTPCSTFSTTTRSLTERPLSHEGTPRALCLPPEAPAVSGWSTQYPTTHLSPMRPIPTQGPAKDTDRLPSACQQLQRGESLPVKVIKSEFLIFQLGAYWDSTAIQQPIHILGEQTSLVVQLPSHAASLEGETHQKASVLLHRPVVKCCWGDLHLLCQVHQLGQGSLRRSGGSKSSGAPCC